MAAPAGAPAQAQAAAAHTQVVKAPMTVRCTVDPRRLKLRPGMNLARLCQDHAPGTTPVHGAVIGDCGLSYLDIFDLGGGTAAFAAGVTSYLGNIDFGEASVNWTNTDIGFSSSYARVVTGNTAPAMWSDFTNQTTGAGHVLGDMDGYVAVGLLTICSIDYPTDFVVIS